MFALRSVRGLMIDIVRRPLVMFITARFQIGALDCRGMLMLNMRGAMHGVHDAGRHRQRIGRRHAPPQQGGDQDQNCLETGTHGNHATRRRHRRQRLIDVPLTKVKLEFTKCPEILANA